VRRERVGEERALGAGGIARPRRRSRSGESEGRSESRADAPRAPTRPTLLSFFSRGTVGQPQRAGCAVSSPGTCSRSPSGADLTTVTGRPNRGSCAGEGGAAAPSRGRQGRRRTAGSSRGDEFQPMAVHRSEVARFRRVETERRSMQGSRRSTRRESRRDGESVPMQGIRRRPSGMRSCPSSANRTATPVRPFAGPHTARSSDQNRRRIEGG